jgi:predicted ferric reductase
MTLHIKDMGEDTFTRQVNQLAQRVSKQEVSAEILVDGPYGCLPPYVEDADALILVGGGIGITPLIRWAFFLARCSLAYHVCISCFSHTHNHAYIYWTCVLSLSASPL